MNIGQIHKYFYGVNIYAWNGCKKSLGGIIRGTLGIKKNAISAPLPCAYGRDNGFCAKSPFPYRKPYKTTLNWWILHIMPIWEQLSWFFEVLVLLRLKVLITRKLLQQTVFKNFASGSHSRVSKMEILPKSSLVSLRWSLLRYLTWFFEILVLLRPKVLIIRKLLQKYVFQSFATGSHNRVSKMEILLKSSWVSAYSS